MQTTGRYTLRNDDRTGEINDDPTLMREWSKYPIRIIKRDNIAPRFRPTNGAVRITACGLRVKSGTRTVKALAALKHALQGYAREVAASFDND